MKHVRIPGRRRLAAAAAITALATTGGTMATIPATAAPVLVPATAADEPPQTTTVRFPLNAEVVSAGATGFLSRTNGPGPELRWTRYADGTSTVLPLSPLRGGASDVVVTGDHDTDITKFRVVKIHDMATGAAPVEVDLNGLGENYVYRGAVGATLVVGVKQADGTMEVRLLTKTGGVLDERTVTGLPVGTMGFSVTAVSADSFALAAAAGPAEARTYHRAAVDVRTAAVTDLYGTTGTQRVEGALSPTRMTWREEEGPTLVVGKRGTAETQRLPLDGFARYGLVGDWLLAARPYVLGQDTRTDPRRALIAVKPDGSDGRVLLEHMSSFVPGPDGSVLVRGGTAEHGEGLYRVTLGEDGKPAAELVASTGEPTSVTLLGSDVPAVIDLDRAKDGIDFTWRLSRKNVKVSLALTRKGGPDWSARTIWMPGGDYPDLGPGKVGWSWHGENVEVPERTAPGGEYVWTISVLPLDGIGPAVRASGSVIVHRTPGAHDYDGNVDPELFARDASGKLWVAPAFYDESRGSLVGFASPVGSGWSIYDRLESSGDIAGTAVADTLARDKSGVLWLYQGSGDAVKPFLGRVKVGGGWQTYDKLAGGSDLTGDGRADLVAADKAGDLYLYKGTGNATAPFAPRRKIGFGWGVYNDLTAVGNLAGGPAGDLVARDKAGVLWLYLGKGDGTFASRVRIGGGWTPYTQLIGVGDANRDGRPDLMARIGWQSYFYAGTGDWRAPFKQARDGQVLGELPGYDEAF
ncbi:FG-GAP-like repeat-containing protein [Streptomyces sp. NPDC012756]|uniref:FG-GAP-like repeat-containing protein n=1 Tax=Streptomyces sp. NPDC012756 TaxID=3364847 RepID=UPI0036AE0BD7